MTLANVLPDALCSILPRGSLIATKLLVPSRQMHLVPRRRLTDLLDNTRNCKLAILSAPAEYGKTTLLSEWVHGQDARTRKVAWVSCDEGDNDPSRFWSSIVGALEIAEPDIGKSVRALAGSFPRCSVEMVLTTIINSLAVVAQSPAAEPVSTHLYLVLDDYHVIHARAIHRGLAFLLDHLPAQVHLILASRTMPPLPLARLRAGGQVLEFRRSDLRFRTDETRAFLHDTGLDLSAEETASLEALTEGWIAGLQLSALSLREQGNWEIPSRHTLGSDEQHISEYLVTEVLNRQPVGVRNFLLDTSILESLSAPLCDAVTAGADSRAMLELLDAANLFIVPLDRPRKWYRYQHLFRETLSGRLRETRPGREALLHGRASVWYEQNGLPAQAIAHALAAGDHARAAALIEQNAALLWNRSEVSSALRWLEELPCELVRAHPRLELVRAWALLGVGQPDDIEQHLEIVERAYAAPATEPLPAAEVDALRVEVLVVRAFAATIQGDTHRGIDLSHRALERLAPDDLRLRTMVAHNLAVACEFAGDLPQAVQALTKASAVAHESDDLFLTLIINRHLGLVHRDQGRLRQAAHLFRQTIDLAEKNGFSDLPVVGLHHVGLGDVLREWNDLDAATANLHQGIDLIKQFRNMFFLVDGYVGLARIQQSRGDVAGGLATLDLALAVIREQGMSRTVAKLAAYQARAWLMQGDVPSAERWAATLCRPAQVQDYELDHVEQTTLARLLVARQKNAAALDKLAQLLEQARRGGRMGNVVEILSLQALALDAEGKPAEACAVLEQALALAEPEGYVRIFADEGLPMIGLLLALRHRKRLGHANGETRSMADYINRLLKACPAAGGDPPLLVQEHLAEPLSHRELEILQTIVDGLSTRDIAAKLMVSINTVKAHRKSIYGKLGVGTRRDAILQARKLHLR